MKKEKMKSRKIHTKKFIIVGTGNDGFRHRYETRKNESFKKAFINFMIELGFDESKMQEIFVDYNGKKGYQEKRISQMNDELFNYHNNGYDVDIFYGCKKIILVVRTKKRSGLIKAIEKHSEFIKIKPVKMIKNKKFRNKKKK